jgi:hypothetical protein
LQATNIARQLLIFMQRRFWHFEHIGFDGEENGGDETTAVVFQLLS